MSVSLCLEREITSTQHGILRFRNGKFRLSGGGDMAQRLVDQLHADTTLMTELQRLDLEALTISISEGKATVTLTPYGGGLAFLAMPPLRYHVAYAPDQVSMTARTLERLAGIINNQSGCETANVSH